MYFKLLTRNSVLMAGSILTPAAKDKLLKVLNPEEASRQVFADVDPLSASFRSWQIIFSYSPDDIETSQSMKAS
jgi:hypothetical protein